MAIIEEDIHLKEVSAERLTSRLEAVYTKESEEVEKKRERWSSHFNASTVADCLRKNAYSQLRILPTRVTGKRSYQLSATIGTLVHDQLQSDMKDEGSLLYVHPSFGPAVEIPLDKVLDPDKAEEFIECNLSGRLDAILELGTLVYVLDIKTTSSDDFRDPSEMSARERGYYFAKLKHWEAQLGIYLHFMRVPDGRRASHGLVLQIDRGSPQRRKQWNLEYNPELVAEDLVRLKEANQYVKRGELPPADPQRGPCNFCGYLSICKPTWPSKEEGVEL